MAHPAPQDRPWHRLALAALPVVVFGATASFGFVHYDDDRYVYQNTEVIGGLSLQSLRWAFAGAHYGNFNPLTWLSHLLDVSLFGLQPAGHHLHNVALHTVNTLMVFALARRWLPIGAALWLAAAFAVHPQHVESVAWVSDRKDLLATLWTLLTLTAYGHWTIQRRWPSYAVMTGCFVAAMLSKPSVAPLPLVLLLADLWLLGRYKAGAMRAGGLLLLEKLPLLAVAVPLLLWAGEAQQELGAVVADSALPWPYRLANAVIGMATYLGKMFWPSALAVHYPHPGYQVDVPLLGLAAASLLAVSAAAWRLRKSQPLLAFGWFSYLLMIAPVAGLVQLGSAARADRFVYLPMLPLLLAIVAVAVRAMQAWSPRRQRAVAAAAIATQMAVTLTILPAWHDTESLMRRACAMTDGNAMAHFDLGLALERRGATDEAETEFRKAFELNPLDARANNKLGNLAMAQKDPKTAVQHYLRAVQSDPSDLGMVANLSIAQELAGDLPAAEATLTALLDRQPGDHAARLRLIGVLGRLKRFEAAEAQVHVLLDGDIRDAEAWDAWGNIAYLEGSFGRAAEAWRLGQRTANEAHNAELAAKIAKKLAQLPPIASTTIIN